MIAHSNIILMLRVGRSTGYGTRTSHSERSQSFKAIRVKERPPLSYSIMSDADIESGFEELKAKGVISDD